MSTPCGLSGFILRPPRQLPEPLFETWPIRPGHMTRQKMYIAMRPLDFLKLFGCGCRLTIQGAKVSRYVVVHFLCCVFVSCPLLLLLACSISSARSLKLDMDVSS